MFYHYRLSRVEFAFGQLPKALAAAKRAVESDSYPTFPILAQLAQCEIESDNLKEAQKTLARIDRTFTNAHRDVRVGLRCRLEIAQGKYREALLKSDNIANKESVFYKKIRLDALEGEVAISALSDSVRAAYEDEINELDKELAGNSAEQFYPDDF
jgi:tetratricopeptide (TPR) repeat protein